MIKKSLVCALFVSLAMAASICAAETEVLPDTYPLSANIEDAFWVCDLTDFSAGIYGNDEEEFTQENFADYDVTMMNLWATWCGPCVQEMPDLAEFAASVPDNVQVVTVCVDYPDPDEIGSVLDYAGYEGITLYELHGDLAAMNNAVTSIPTTLFFDSKGRAVGRGVIGGVQDFKEFYTERIDEILTGMGLETMASSASGETETEDTLSDNNVSEGTPSDGDIDDSALEAAKAAGAGKIGEIVSGEEE